MLDKVRLNLKEFCPAKIIPKQGELKKLSVVTNGINLILKTSHCKEITIPHHICLDENSFIAIGLYFAEGTKYINLDKKTKHCGEIAFANSELNCILLVCELLDRLGINLASIKWKVGINVNYKNEIDKENLFNYWTSKTNLSKNSSRPKWLYYSGRINGRLSNNTSKYGCFHIFYSSVIFRNFFLNFIQKIFEDSIKNKSKVELALILRGIFAGDGNVDYSLKYNRKQVEFCCNDLRLLENIRKSLKILGLKSIRETWPESTKTHTKSLRIYNKHDFKILQKYDIPNFTKYKKKDFKKIINGF